MYVIKEDDFYELIAEYPDRAVDYCIVANDEKYNGLDSHKKALFLAATKLFAACGGWTFDIRSAAAKEAEAKAFFTLSEQLHNCKITEKKEYSVSYWRAFLMPPHGNSYTDDDFVRINSVLFPNGTDGLEVYEWSTDWSDYFAEGREWWGALCVTIYDKTLARFVIMMSSASD